MSIADIAKPRLLRQKPATLVVASLAFTEDGRVLTKEDGTIPHENVDMDGIYEVHVLYKISICKIDTISRVSSKV